MVSISTEEAERMARRLHRIGNDFGHKGDKKGFFCFETADSLRSLAAERDGLRVALRRILGVANTWDHATEAHIARDALWKERDD